MTERALLRGLGALAFGLCVAPVPPASAQDSEACAGFAWPVARERAALTRPDLPVSASGAALLEGTQAVRLRLNPAAEAALPVPSAKPEKAGTFSGFVTATIPVPGTYHVTLSDAAWLDVSQDGRTLLKPAAHSGKVGCEGVRKTLRFTLAAGPVTIEISHAPAPAIGLALLQVE